MHYGVIPQPTPEGVLLKQDATSEKRRDERLARMLEVEDEILQRSQQICLAVASFTEITPTTVDPPPHWITEFGEEGARQRLELAKTGWEPQGEMRVGVKLAQTIMVGIAKARGHRMSVRAHTLNVQIQLPAPTSAEHPGGQTYQEIDIE